MVTSGQKVGRLAWEIIPAGWSDTHEPRPGRTRPDWLKLGLLWPASGTGNAGRKAAAGTGGESEKAGTGTDTGTDTGNGNANGNGRR